MFLEFFYPNLECLFIYSYLVYLILAPLYSDSLGYSWTINHSKAVLSLGHSSEPVIIYTSSNFSVWL